MPSTAHSCRSGILLLALLCLELVLPSGGGARGDDPVSFDAPDALRSVAAQLRTVQDRSLSTALGAAGLSRPGGPIRVLLAPEDSRLAAQAPPWVVGYASGANGLIVILVERVPSYPYDSVESVLTHELVHVLVARAARGRAVPRWFDEGLATAAADPWDLEDRARLVFAMVGAEGITRHELSELFAQGPGAARRAYVLSAAFVASMIDAWGPGFPGRLLALVGEEVSFSDAFTRLTSTTLDDFEDAFWASQRWWNHWVPLLTSSTMLWAAMTMLVFYAFRRRRQQARAIQERWRSEDDDA